MMRKVIWWGTALLACMMIAATMAAYYAAENPDSAFAQGTLAACDWCAWFNPVWAVDRVAVPVACSNKPCPAPEPWMPAPECVPEPQEPPPEAGQAAPVAVSDPIEVTEQITQPAEPIIVEEETTLPIIQETQEPATWQPEPFMNPSQEAGVDDVPVFMPYADDDDAVLQQAKMDKPDFMTQLINCFMDQECGSEELGCALFAEAIADFLKELVGDDSSDTAAPVVPDDPIEDTTSANPAEVLPYPLEDIKEQQPMSENPMPESTVETGAGVGAAVGAIPPTTPETPVGVETPASGSQESNPPMPENTNLQEDPSYHHQYPSCPYTGQCPYTGHCPYPYHYNVPSVPYTEPTQQPVNVTKPKKPTKVKPVQPTKPVKPVEKVDPMVELETFGVDTMECRPTDVSGYLPGTGPF
jgi:hypothetical protein